MKKRLIATLEHEGREGDSLLRVLDEIEGLEFELIRPKAEEIFDLLRRRTVDFCVLDAGIDSPDCLSLLAQLRRGGYLGPLLVVADEERLSIALRSVAVGADVYLMRATMTPESVRRALNVSEMQHLGRRSLEGSRVDLREPRPRPPRPAA